MRALECENRPRRIAAPTATAMSDDCLERTSAIAFEQRDVRGVDTEDDLPRFVALHVQLKLRAIPIVQALVPKPIPLGVVNAFSDRKRAMSECGEFSREMTGKERRKDVRGFAV